MPKIDISKTILREVTHSDVKLIYDWANDSETRSSSFSSEKIDWETHVKWFKGKMSDTNCHMFILTYNNSNLGIIRMDYDNNHSLYVSYSIDKKYRRLGLGTRIIKLAEYKAIKMHELNPEIIYISGKVMSSNIGSRKCFENNNYTMVNDYENEITFQKILY